jgi:hypothetical protein
MKAEEKFMEIFGKMPEKARKELVARYPTHPMSLNVIALEVKNRTILGKGLLRELGFWDDEDF